MSYIVANIKLSQVAYDIDIATYQTARSRIAEEPARSEAQTDCNNEDAAFMLRAINEGMIELFEILRWAEVSAPYPTEKVTSLPFVKQEQGGVDYIPVENTLFVLTQTFYYGTDVYTPGIYLSNGVGYDKAETGTLIGSDVISIANKPVTLSLIFRSPSGWKSSADAVAKKCHAYLCNKVCAEWFLRTLPNESSNYQTLAAKALQETVSLFMRNAPTAPYTIS